MVDRLVFVIVLSIMAGGAVGTPRAKVVTLGRSGP
jgi:hypothetical protein